MTTYLLHVIMAMFNCHTKEIPARKETLRYSQANLALAKPSG